MTYVVDKQKDQRLVHSGVSWHNFKSIQAGFVNSPGIRLFYYRGEVEILAVSQEHEAFSGVIALLLGTYFVEKQIEFTPTGSFTPVTRISRGVEFHHHGYQVVMVHLTKQLILQILIG
ncbi:hypothetical protein [Moorena sp. SIO3I8]|uniref:hypothetical protein n=1 Tax=Moorena sp. SIO3I8 TaxID=2607833 RepID=UPI002600F8A2|nr:hypothetical protein [Moorena sp. SIO3I8]